MGFMAFQGGFSVLRRILGDFRGVPENSRWFQGISEGSVRFKEFKERSMRFQGRFRVSIVVHGVSGTCYMGVREFQKPLKGIPGGVWEYQERCKSVSRESQRVLWSGEKVQPFFKLNISTSFLQI